MATLANKITLEISWENGVGFEVTSQQNSDPAVNILECQENGHIKELWRDYQSAVEKYVKLTLEDVGKDMAQPNP